MSWLRVTWTEAGQILALCDEAAAPDTALAGVEPKAYFDRLVAAGEYDRAIAFVGSALPRREAVQWAAEAIARGPLSVENEKRVGRHELLHAVLGWLADPSEERRRAAWTAASRNEQSSPEKLLACAVYFSGGSIAPEDCEPVQPVPHVCGRLAATAILASAYQSENADQLLRFAVAEGDRFAST